MLIAVARAVELFTSKRNWSALVRNGMQADFSWKVAADKYINTWQAKD
jgi:glycogen synthase